MRRTREGKISYPATAKKGTSYHFTSLSLHFFHGDFDDVIPVGRGRELARLYPAMTTYRELQGVGHSGFFADHMPLILDAMSDDGDKP